jgi:hypothetical protein
MCTVTFIARKRGYCLGMNRDEQRTRPAGLPPQKKPVNGRSVLAPSEPGGGTWIAVNDAGATHALINWYSIATRVDSNPVSRGEVVNAMSALCSPQFAKAALAGLPMLRINPFRLIGIYPAARQTIEWRWDLKNLTSVNHQWERRHWVSSGYDEVTAQRVRGKTFQRFQRQRSAGSLDWLRRLHLSHFPATGPFSICMHRPDAATVSYTEISVSPGNATMRHHSGPPCQNPASSLLGLKLEPIS